MEYSERDELVNAVRVTASRWREPDYTRREAAVAAMLNANDVFTEEALAFAVNQGMHSLLATLESDVETMKLAAKSAKVGVLHTNNMPLAGFAEALAVLLTGNAYIGIVPENSGYLLGGFLSDLMDVHPSLRAAAVAPGEIVKLDALVSTESVGEGEAGSASAERGRVPEERCFIERCRFSIAVLDGEETEEDLEGLAEDALLYDGRACGSLRIIFAPQDATPDALLESFSAFRAVSPQHPRLGDSLKMQQAFLQAVGQPHAYGEGLAYLVSRGEAEVQSPGHVRWVPYADLNEVQAWLTEHLAEVRTLVAREGLVVPLAESVPRATPGNVHRRPLTEQMQAGGLLTFLLS